MDWQNFMCSFQLSSVEAPIISIHFSRTLVKRFDECSRDASLINYGPNSAIIKGSNLGKYQKRTLFSKAISITKSSAFFQIYQNWRYWHTICRNERNRNITYRFFQVAQRRMGLEKNVSNSHFLNMCISNKTLPFHTSRSTTPVLFTFYFVLNYGKYRERKMIKDVRNMEAIQDEIVSMNCFFPGVVPKFRFICDSLTNLFLHFNFDVDQWSDQSFLWHFSHLINR